MSLKKNAQEQDVVNLFTLVLATMAEVKQKLSDQIKQHQEEVTIQNQTISDSLRTLEDATMGKLSSQESSTSSTINSLFEQLKSLEEEASSLRLMMAKNTGQLSADIDKVVLRVFKELKRIEAAIPSLPDTTPIENRITSVEQSIASLPKLPDPLVLDDGSKIIEKINDAEEKIDASRIKNLPKAGTKSVFGGHVIAGQNIKVNGQVVGLNIPIQTTAPTNPNTNDLWIQI